MVDDNNTTRSPGSMLNNIASGAKQAVSASFYTAASTAAAAVTGENMLKDAPLAGAREVASQLGKVEGLGPAAKSVELLAVGFEHLMNTSDQVASSQKALGEAVAASGGSFGDAVGNVDAITEQMQKFQSATGQTTETLNQMINDSIAGFPQLYKSVSEGALSSSEAMSRMTTTAVDMFMLSKRSGVDFNTVMSQVTEGLKNQGISGEQAAAGLEVLRRRLEGSTLSMRTGIRVTKELQDQFQFLNLGIDETGKQIEFAVKKYEELEKAGKYTFASSEQAMQTYSKALGAVAKTQQDFGASLATAAMAGGGFEEAFDFMFDEDMTAEQRQEMMLEGTREMFGGDILTKEQAVSQGRKEEFMVQNMFMQQRFGLGSPQEAAKFAGMVEEKGLGIPGGELERITSDQLSAQNKSNEILTDIRKTNNDLFKTLTGTEVTRAVRGGAETTQRLRAATRGNVVTGQEFLRDQFQQIDRQASRIFSSDSSERAKGLSEVEKINPDFAKMLQSQEMAQEFQSAQTREEKQAVLNRIKDRFSTEQSQLNVDPNAAPSSSSDRLKQSVNQSQQSQTIPNTQQSIRDGAASSELKKQDQAIQQRGSQQARSSRQQLETYSNNQLSVYAKGIQQPKSSGLMSQGSSILGRNSSNVFGGYQSDIENSAGVLDYDQIKKMRSKDIALQDASISKKTESASTDQNPQKQMQQQTEVIQQLAKALSEARQPIEVNVPVNIDSNTVGHAVAKVVVPLAKQTAAENQSSGN